MPDETGMTADIVSRLARLIGLDIDDRRAAELAPQLEVMRENIRTLGDVDLADVEPLPSPVRPELLRER